jgi:predicted DNA-binding helix-hairpin-helix protein
MNEKYLIYFLPKHIVPEQDMWWISSIKGMCLVLLVLVLTNTCMYDDVYQVIVKS